MNNKYVLILVLFFSSVALADRGVVGVIFHSSYCEAVPEARLSYLSAINKQGYTVVDLCVSTRSTSELKMDIEAEAEKQNIKWADIEGINIIGPVVDTLLLPSLSSNSKKPMSAVAGLMFDDFEFSYNDSHLIKVDSNYFMPSKVRWVSQLFTEALAWDQIAEGLSKAETQLISVDERGCGEHFSDELFAGLDKRRARVADNWSSFPNGIGWNLMAYVSTIGAWYVTGVSRDMWGYNTGFNRLQTPTDKFMYLFVIYPGLAVINAFSTYKLADHLFSRSLPNDDLGWKKYVLSKRLVVDGLAGQAFCAGKNKAP